MRHKRLEDVFKIVCKTCGSEDVDLYVQKGTICDVPRGNIIEAECDSCGTCYRPHDFEMIEEA